jgi:hypothetical protein
MPNEINSNAENESQPSLSSDDSSLPPKDGDSKNIESKNIESNAENESQPSLSSDDSSLSPKDGDSKNIDKQENSPLESSVVEEAARQSSENNLDLKNKAIQDLLDRQFEKFEHLLDRKFNNFKDEMLEYLSKKPENKNPAARRNPRTETPQQEILRMFYEKEKDEESFKKYLDSLPKNEIEKFIKTKKLKKATELKTMERKEQIDIIYNFLRKDNSQGNSFMKDR